VRVFLDTNVLVSSIATRGLCSEVFEGTLHDHELLTCDAVLSELERILLTRMRLPGSVVAEFLALLREEGQLVGEQQAPSISIADPDDVPIIACALGGRADVFVTGDKALLDLRVVDGLPVVSPRELWMKLAGL
jgi:putative PIN family toxin of toxin-antitoxin system